MKKILYIILISLIAFSFTGCGDNNNKDGNAPKNSYSASQNTPGSNTNIPNDAGVSPTVIVDETDTTPTNNQNNNDNSNTVINTNNPTGDDVILETFTSDSTEDTTTQDNDNEPTNTVIETTPTNNDDTQEDNSPEEEPLEDNNLVEIELDAFSFAFSQSEIRVKEGQTIKITITNTGGTHDFILDGFGVGTSILSTGESETIEFVADKKGTFEYFCSVGNHRAQGMLGNLIVE